MTTIAQTFQNIENAASKNPEKATSANAIFLFQLGDDGGTWTVDLRSETRENFAYEGAAENPNVTISMAASDWLGIFDGSVNPMQAFMMGKIKVQGDMTLAMKLQNILQLANS